MEANELTDAERNQLRAFINTEAGKKLLLKFVQEELENFAVAYNKKSSLEKQGQLLNRNSGIYWCRTLIEDLIKPSK